MLTISKKFVIFIFTSGEQKDVQAERKKRAEIRIKKLSE